MATQAMSFPLELEHLPNLAKLGAFTDNQTYSKAHPTKNNGTKTNTKKKQVGTGDDWKTINLHDDYFLRFEVCKMCLFVDEMPDALTKLGLV